MEPPRPSTRVSSLGGEAGIRAAAARQAEVAALARELRSELEWIPLKAMRKDRVRRYASPLQLAEDCAPYLAGKPLIAAPESRTYRARKFVERNRVALATAGAFAVLSLGAVGAYVHGISAEQRKTSAPKRTGRRSRHRRRERPRNAAQSSQRTLAQCRTSAVGNDSPI